MRFKICCLASYMFCNQSSWALTDKENHISFSMKFNVCQPRIVPFLVAQDKKLFSKNNVFLDMKKTAENADFFIAGRREVYASEAQKSNQYKAVIGSYMDEEHSQYAILVPKNSKISKLSDLENKTLIIESSSGGARFKLVDEILKKNKVNRDLIKIESRYYNGINSNELNQAIYIREPELSILLGNGQYRILADEPVLSNFFSPWPMSYGMVSTRLLHKNRDLVSRLILSLDEAIDIIRQDPDYSLSLLNKCLKQNGHKLKTNVRQQAFWKRDEFNKDIIQKQIDLYLRLELMKHRIKVDDFLYMK